MKRGSASPVNAVTAPTRSITGRLAGLARQYNTSEISVLPMQAARYVYLTYHPLCHHRTRALVARGDRVSTSGRVKFLTRPTGVRSH
jgi:hypothetical protein